MITKRPPRLLIFILTAGLFISSLFTHGPLIELLGMVMTFLYCVALNSSRRDLLNPSTAAQIFWAFAVVTAFFLWFIMSARSDVPAEAQEAAPNNYRFFLIFVIYVFSLKSLLKKLPNHVVIALKYVIVLHDIILLVQTAVMMATGYFLDFVSPFTGEESRYQINDTLNPIFSFRPTGMFLEPSHFSATLCVIAIGYIVLCETLGHRSSKAVLFLTAFCIFVTQSTAGVVQGLLLLASIVLLQSRSGRVWTLLAALIGVVGFSGILIQYFDSFFMKFHETADIRVELLNYIYNTRTGWDFIAGFGPFGIDSALWRMATVGKDAQVASLNDAGLMNYFVVQFGVVGLIIPILMFIRVEKNLTYILFLSLLLTTKLSYVHPVLYFGLLPLLMARKHSSGRTPAGPNNVMVQQNLQRLSG